MTADKVDVGAAAQKALAGLLAQRGTYEGEVPICEDDMRAALDAIDFPNMLRVYRAWEGAAVGEVGIVQFDVDAYCNEVWTEADTSALAGTRVRLVPDGDAQGGR